MDEAGDAQDAAVDEPVTPRSERRKISGWKIAIIALAGGVSGMISAGVMNEDNERRAYDDAALASARDGLGELADLTSEPFSDDPSDMLDWMRRLNALLAAVEGDAAVLAAFEDLMDGDVDLAATSQDANELRMALAAFSQQADVSGELHSEVLRAASSSIFHKILDRVRQGTGIAGWPSAEELVWRTAVADEVVRSEDPSRPVAEMYARHRSGDLSADLAPVASSLARNYPRRDLPTCTEAQLLVDGRCYPNLSGLWIGRAQGTIANCTFDVSLTLSIVQDARAAVFDWHSAGSQFAEDCSVVGDETLQFRGTVDADGRVRSGNLRLALVGANAIEGSITGTNEHGSAVNATFFVGRQG